MLFKQTENSYNHQRTASVLSMWTMREYCLTCVITSDNKFSVLYVIRRLRLYLEYCIYPNTATVQDWQNCAVLP